MRRPRLPSLTTVAGLVLAAALFLSVIGPILTVLIWAFAEQWRFPDLLPSQWGLRFWATTMNQRDVVAAVVTSFSLASIATTLSALICWPAAYAFARLRFPLRRSILLAFLAANAFPKFPLYIVIALIFLRLNLVGTYGGVVLIQMISALLYMIWIPTSAFRSIPPILEEAAFDLGASRLRVFLEVTVPQALPALAASYILAFVTVLFEVDGALIVGSPTIATMPVKLLVLSNDVLVQRAAVLCIVVWVPVFLLLLFSRRLLGGRSVAAGLGA